MNFKQQNLVVWGSELSPFTLKVQRLLRQTKTPFRFLPEEGSTLENLRYALRRERLLKKWLAITWPLMSIDDELPLVPFIYDANNTQHNYYDSSALAVLLDSETSGNNPFIPKDPAIAFLVKLIDEYADEYGLYIVHHNRWVVSAASNNAGKRLAHEFRSIFRGSILRKIFGSWFSKRQIKRLPYLFSVAPQKDTYSNVPKSRRPPTKKGFPPTHQLLDDSFERLLAALETVLTQRPYLFGNAMTLADISIYGQLGMNLTDPDANHWMKTKAPATHIWVHKLHSTPYINDTNTGYVLDELLTPLINEICRTFVPLMQQNHAAVDRYKKTGARHFNEKAFNRSTSLYNGFIDSVPYRSVAKTFQAKVWSKLCEDWKQLPPLAQQQLMALGVNSMDKDSHE